MLQNTNIFSLLWKTEPRSSHMSYIPSSSIGTGTGAGIKTAFAKLS